MGNNRLDGPLHRGAAYCPTCGVIIFLALRTAVTGSPKIDDIDTNGNLLALATLFSTSATVGLIALLIVVRRYPVRDYLALYWPPPRSVLTAVLGLALVLVATDLSSYLLGKPLVPPFMVNIYRSSWLPASVALVVVPVGEEALFRGFMFKGIAASKGGPLLAIIISSFVFTLLHVFQYDWFAVAGVAAMGFFWLHPLSVPVTSLDHALACRRERVRDAGVSRAGNLADVNGHVNVQGKRCLDRQSKGRR